MSLPAQLLRNSTILLCPCSNHFKASPMRYAGQEEDTTIIALKPPGAPDSTFHPYWCPDRLKGEIKRRCTSYYLTSVGDQYIFFFKRACTTRTRMTTWKRPFLYLTGLSVSHILPRSTQVRLAALGLGPLWSTESSKCAHRPNSYGIPLL